MGRGQWEGESPGIFKPIESIAAVVRDIRKGGDKRVGNLAKDDEIGELAEQFDATLNLLTLRNEEIRQAAERLESKVDERTRELKEQNQRLGERNRALAAEVLDLKKGLEAVEEKARREMGMVKEGETFYQIVDRASFSGPVPKE